DGVAGELLHGPAEAPDALGRALEVLRNAAPDDLRVRGRDERGRVEEIDEQDRGELAFHDSSLGVARGVTARRSGPSSSGSDSRFASRRSSLSRARARPTAG